MVRYLLLLLLVGCGDNQPYVKPPQINEATIRFEWMTNDQIAKRCSEHSFACGTVGSVEMPNSTIYAEMPQGFGDTNRVCLLGHEVLHSLGATHR